MAHLEDGKMLARMPAKPIGKAILSMVPVIQGHLDLEGFAYIKVTRTGTIECFAADETSEALKRNGFDYKEQSKTFWKNPAMEKFGKKAEREKTRRKKKK